LDERSADDGNAGKDHRSGEETFARSERIRAGNEDEDPERVHDQNAPGKDLDDRADGEKKKNGNE
jgi:hypothetical protein